MQTTERPLGQRLLRGIGRLLATVFVLGLIGLVAYLASERNASAYSLKQEAGQLVVQKGRMLPTGSEPWTPTDSKLADAYAPIPLEGTTPSSTVLTQTFRDRDELDRALFGVLETLARPRVSSEDPKVVDRGLYYVRRMERLSGLTSEQRTTLERLQSEIAWHLARNKLDQARQLLSEALSQLEVASTGQTENARRANQLAAQIVAPTREFEDTLRKLLAGVPAPPPAKSPNEEKPPEPTKTPEAAATPDATEPRASQKPPESVVTPEPATTTQPAQEPPEPPTVDGDALN